MEYIVELKNVSKKFGGKQVIDSVNMHIRKGEIYGFVGSNGAGKTTIMKMMLDLIQPDHGDIFILGNKVNENNSEIKRHIGSIIENPFFYEKLTGRKNLEIHAKYMGVKNTKYVEEVLDMVSLGEASSKKVSQYSLGMKQRLAIARAVLVHPELLILDEPINALDPQGIMEMRTLFSDLSHKYGMTILISSHILSEVEQIADKIGVIKKGRILKEADIVNYQKDYIELIVSDVAKAEMILKTKYTNFIIKNENHIYFEGADFTTEELSSLLVKHDVGLISISKKKKSLEDYFFEVTSD